MVLEHAVIAARTGAHFEESVAEARSVIAASHGFIPFHLHGGIEAPAAHIGEAAAR